MLDIAGMHDVSKPKYYSRPEFGLKISEDDLIVYVQVHLIQECRESKL